MHMEHQFHKKKSNEKPECVVILYTEKMKIKMC